MTHQLIYHKADQLESNESPFDAAYIHVANGNHIDVTSPYIGLDYFKRITHASSSWRLITDVREWMGSHSISQRLAITDFLAVNHERIKHCKDLHAKVVIGPTSAVIGSANLTYYGVCRRTEMSVLIDGLSEADELRSWFNSVWDACDYLTREIAVQLSDSLPSPNTSMDNVSISSRFRGVNSRLIALEDDGKALAHQGLNAAAYVESTVYDVLRALNTATNSFAMKLIELLADSDTSEVRTTEAQPNAISGKDIRFHMSGIFAELWFLQRGDKVNLKLWMKRGTLDETGLDCTWVEDYKCRIKLDAHKDIPANVIDGIAIAKKFIS